MSRTHRERDAVFAVVRFDPWAGEPELQFTVKEVVWDQALAVAEVARLNELNDTAGCRYFWQPTRLFPPGAAAGRPSDPDVRPAT